MRKLSWNLRIVLGLFALVIILIILFGIYYNIVRASHNKAPEVEAYPGATLVSQEKRDGWDHHQYLSKSDALAIEGFYRERDFTCRQLYGDIYENGIRKENVYLHSSCLLDRSHALGFHQSAQLIIQPQRTPYQYRDNNPANEIVGGGELTGDVVIDIQRQWGNDGLVGD